MRSINNEMQCDTFEKEEFGNANVKIDLLYQPW